MDLYTDYLLSSFEQVTAAALNMAWKQLDEIKKYQIA